MIVFGKRMLGKCDAVPGMFHVATQFFHIDYMPLVPLKTYIVVSQTGNTFRGVAIPMSGKSVLCAWGRTLTFLTAIIAGIAVIVQLNDFRNGTVDKMIPLAIAAMAGLAFGFMMWHRSCTKASFTRACQLGSLVGMNEAALTKLYALYGESAGRGFDVVPIQPTQLIQPAIQAKTPPLPAMAALYPCRVCGKGFTVDQAYTEADGRTICKSCWTESTAAADAPVAPEPELGTSSMAGE